MYFFYLTQRDWNCIFELTLLENNNLNLIWKIYCMVFFNFLVICSYKNAIYCYKYDIDIWIQSIILTSFYSFSQGAWGSFDPNIFEVYILEVHYLVYYFCYIPAFLCNLWSVHDEAAWDPKETRWEHSGFTANFHF